MSQDMITTVLSGPQHTPGTERDSWWSRLFARIWPWSSGYLADPATKSAWSTRARPADLAEKISILHLWAGNLYGGVESFLVTLARHRHLCPTLVQHFGLCFEGRLSEELQATGATTHLLGDVRLSRPWTVWSARRRLRKLLAQEGFDVVCCHGCWPHAVFAPAVRGRVPLVFWAHDFASGQGPIERRARRTLPDLVLANSRATAATLASLFPGVNTEAIGLAVAPPPANEDHSIQRATLRSSLGVPEDGIVIVQASRLESWKGHTVLLRALGRLREMPDWTCWIAGGVQRPHEAAYLAELQTLAAAQGITDRVRFLGQRGDVPAVLAAADIHCQPNTGPEPFGIAFVEALYAGLPVVTSAFGGAVETVDDTCGRLVPPGDDVALAAVLRRLIGEPELRARLAAAGPGRAVECCDPATHLARLNGLLRQLLSSKVTA